MGPGFESLEVHHNNKIRTFSNRRRVRIFVFYGRKISIDCTGVEDALDVTMAQQTELDYLIYNDPLDYADLILNGDPKEYLKNVSGSRTLKD